MADRRDAKHSLFLVAAAQAGYFSAAQAVAVGFSYQAQAHHVQAGNWLRVERGVFRFVDWVPGLHDELAMWTLWSKGKAVVSHESAMSVHGIGEFESSRLHMTVGRNFRMSDDAVVLHRSELGDADVEERTGFRVTTMVRSLIDISSESPDEEQLSRAIDEARQAGLLTIRSLRARAELLDVGAALRIERAINIGVAS